MVGDRSGRKTELVRRLHCAESHLGGIIAMIERGTDWRSVIHQIWAVQGALVEIKGLIVTLHLTTCLEELLTDTDREAGTRERSLTAVISLYRLLGASLCCQIEQPLTPLNGGERESL